MPYIGVSPSNGVRQTYDYTATAGQTSFSGSDNNSQTLTYTDSAYIDVYQNGILLVPSDYTATTGTTVVLDTGATVSDTLQIVVYDVFSVADTVSASDGGSFGGNVGVGGTLSVTGATTLSSTLATTGNATFSGDIIKSTSGTNNFAAGVNAGNSIQSGGNFNTVVGDEAGTALTTGDDNTAVGYGALYTEDEHGKNTAVGTNSLLTLNAGADGRNTAVGYFSGRAMTTGINNTVIGSEAGDALTVGSDNVAIGFEALTTETAGSRSVAIGEGALALQNNTSATNAENVAVGMLAGRSTTTGKENVCIGHTTGYSITTSSQNTIVGKGAEVSSHSGSGKEIVLGYNTASVGSQYFTFGESNGASRVYNNFTSNASWTRVSDERYKKDITDNTDCGLDFINDLRTVTFKFKAKSEIDNNLPDYDKSATEADCKHKLYGLIAQEVKSAMDNNNITDFGGWHEQEDNDHDTQKIQGIAESMFVYPLIKAVQELSAKNDALEARIKTLESK